MSALHVGTTRSRRTAEEGAVGDAAAEALASLLRRPPRRLECRGSDYASSYPLYEIDVWLEGEERRPMRLVLKSLRPIAEGVGPRRGPDREIVVYRDVLRDAGLGTPAYIGAWVDRRAWRHWLFLERVTGARLAEVGEFGSWTAAATWAARLHARLSGEAPALVASGRLARLGEAEYRRVPRRALALRRGSPGAGTLLRHVARRYDRVIDRLRSLPATVIHGEYYASNILVERDSGRIRPVDWERATVGPGLLDMAALAGGAWSDGQRADLLSAYCAAARRLGAPLPPPDGVGAAFDCCRLHLALQWVGWARDWSPPAEHARDWLGEVAQLTARLDL